ncbi:MAG TPA: hypothetical protein VFV89_01940 [Nocardioides sp.]|uniref:hypothetical protein n=1 Tax=Nocardioides sp. TaxID=35761 RepID=UPI002E309BD3|nr:hypothetical protein [Nocardioides sp.]HEX5086536.1 hypothetical protein [Nocardioides sp.]
MVELVSWVAVAVIGLFALVGFLGVVATTLLSAVRVLRGQTAVEPAEARERIASAA